MHAVLRDRGLEGPGSQVFTTLAVCRRQHALTLRVSSTPPGVEQLSCFQRTTAICSRWPFLYVYRVSAPFLISPYWSKAIVPVTPL